MEGPTWADATGDTWRHPVVRQDARRGASDEGRPLFSLEGLAPGGGRDDDDPPQISGRGDARDRPAVAARHRRRERTPLRLVDRPAAETKTGRGTRGPRRRAPGRDRRGPFRRFTGTATTPHASTRDAFAQAELGVSPERGVEGYLSPNGRGPCRRSGGGGDPAARLCRRPNLSAPQAHDFEDFERADATQGHTTSEGGILGPESRGKSFCSSAPAASDPCNPTCVTLASSRVVSENAPGDLKKTKENRDADNAAESKG
jgi:hypothetical protein